MKPASARLRQLIALQIKEKRLTIAQATNAFITINVSNISISKELKDG